MVKTGQIYADKDKRMESRYVLVDDIRNGRARCLPCTVDGKVMYGRCSRVAVANLEKRFRLVKDA